MAASCVSARSLKYSTFETLQIGVEFEALQMCVCPCSQVCLLAYTQGHFKVATLSHFPAFVQAEQE